MSKPEDDTARWEAHNPSQTAPFPPDQTDLGIPVRIELDRTFSESPGPRLTQLAGRYAIVEEIGRGGMGVVYKAFDRDLRRHVAMKRLSAALANDADCLGRFVEEAQATGQLEHPGIVAVHEIGRDPQGQLFFTMQLVRGRTLAQVVSDLRAGDEQTAQRFNLFRLLQIFIEVCRAVHYAHERGVIHRDLKPSNVMVGRHGDVQVMDWGLVKVWAREEPRAAPKQFGSSQEVSLDLHRDATRAGSMLGTPAYMAPEQAEVGGDAPGPASDVYALGAILFHLLTGRPPFVEPTAQKTVAALLTRRPDRPSKLERSVPRELDAICLRALEKEPGRRYPSAESLGDDVQSFLEGRPVLALPIGRMARMVKFARREPVVAGLLGLLLVALVTLSGALWLTMREKAAKEGDAELKRLALVAMQRAHAELEVGYRQLADLGLIEVFFARLGRAHTDNAERVRWLDDLRPLAERGRQHAAVLAELEVRLGGADPDSLSLRQKHRDLSRVVQRLAELERFATGLASPRVGLDSAALAARWQEAISAIADTAVCPVYGGLKLAAVQDLLPVGRDPQSGLWEFAHIWSGAPPERDASGQLAVSESLGMVFVLIPGGSFQMGMVDAYEGQWPLHTVHMSPFLLSKYELTQQQWQRLTGETPSYFSNERHGVDFFKATQPVENISWNDCSRCAASYGLLLPSEAQWEYAARAGTTGTWWFGDDARDASSCANTVGPADGFVYVSPVGSFHANPWGLHDTLGNVWEWCCDVLAETTGAEERWDPVVSMPDVPSRSVRGGNWAMPPDTGDPSIRLGFGPNEHTPGLGLRLARELPSGADVCQA